MKRMEDTPKLHWGRRGLLALLALLLVLMLAAVLFGSTRLSLGELLQALDAGDRESPAWRIFFHVRLPRMLAGALCGSGLAVAGAVLQVVLNNSLAGPNIIGVNAGAGFAALIAMSLFPNRVSALPAAAFLGALGCTVLIYALARKTGASRMTIVLAGVAVSSILNAASGALKILFPDVLAAYNSFSVGTLNGVTLRQLAPAMPYIVAGLAAAQWLSGAMNVLSLGEEVAQSLGLNVRRCRLLLILAAAVLAGASVSVCGLVGFVGLLVPHTARLLFGSDNRLVIRASALLGACAVILCDLVGRMIFAPFEIPVGILLSLIGGGYFLWLLLRRRGGGKLHA